MISRKAAINTAEAMWKRCDGDVDDYHALMVESLTVLPSASSGADEWCTDCKEYDQERHCCPRWNRVIRETLADSRSVRMSDGTLMVTVPNGTVVRRVLVSEEGTSFGGLYYPDGEDDE